MRTKNLDLSPHSQKVLALLQQQDKALSAYDILDRLRDSGIKAPPTVYRALDALMERGLAHRIESLNAFVACHGHEKGHAAQFAVCRACGTVVEIHDHRLSDSISDIGKSLHFHVEREMLELLGLCQRCDTQAQAAGA